MTVPNTTNKMPPYVGDGVTTVFPYTFRIFAASDLLVIRADVNKVETVLVNGVDYTVSGAGSYAGGAVTLTAALAVDTTLLILRRLSLTQETDLRNQGRFLAETAEDALDRAVMRDQQLQTVLDRSVKIPESVSGLDVELPAPVGSALIGWNEDGTALTNMSALSALEVYGSNIVNRFDSGTGFTAGVTTSLILSETPTDKRALDINFDGVVQQRHTFEVSGSTVTFNAPIPTGTLTVEVLIRWAAAIPTETVTGAEDWGLVTGAVDSTDDYGALV